MHRLIAKRYGMSKIFIVDDDPIHQRIAQIMIKTHRIYDEFVSFDDAQSALTYLAEHASASQELPDVILLDLNMPQLDGWGFLDQFNPIAQRLNKKVRIFIVSSSVDEKDISRSRVYPYVHGFISKPLSPAILKSTR